MKNSKLEIKDIQQNLDKKQLINKLVSLNIKGGGNNCPPPFGEK